MSDISNKLLEDWSTPSCLSVKLICSCTIYFTIEKICQCLHAYVDNNMMQSSKWQNHSINHIFLKVWRYENTHSKVSGYSLLLKLTFAKFHLNYPAFCVKAALSHNWFHFWDNTHIFINTGAADYMHDDFM